ncbi:MAG: hypothetical protein KF686_03395 [Ramlibacter sp.]|nr:hypothetical protein [Ramlibacter sp.]
MPAQQPTYTKEELDGLTPDERSAIEAETGDEDALTEIAAGGDEDDDGKGGAAEAGAGAEAGAEGKSAGEAAAGEEGKAATTEEPAKGPDPTVYIADAGDADAKIQEQRDAVREARNAEKEALKKLNDGEIDFEAYDAIRSESETKIDTAQAAILDLNNLKTRATVAAEMNEQNQLKAWNGMVAAYRKEALADGLDYSGEAGAPLLKEVNTLIKAFASEAVANGLSDANNMEASAWALQQARQVMAMRHKKAGPAPTPAPAGAPAAAPAAADPAAPAALRHNLKTLGGMPAAAGNVTSDESMSKIATLEGEELELYLAGQSKADIERLMANS